nr:hypothetical protein [Tanacetum cinerariifolium]
MLLREIQVSNGLGPKEKLTILFLVQGNPQHALKDKGVIDSGCSRHMTGNMSYLSDFEELKGRYVAFGGNPKGGKISGKALTTGALTTVTLGEELLTLGDGLLLMCILLGELGLVIIGFGLADLGVADGIDVSTCWAEGLGDFTCSRD